LAVHDLTLIPLKLLHEVPGVQRAVHNEGDNEWDDPIEGELDADGDGEADAIDEVSCGS
jgi:hypothetical protein